MNVRHHGNVGNTWGAAQSMQILNNLRIDRAIDPELNLRILGIHFRFHW